MDIADVNLNDRCFDATNGIVYGYRCVRVGARVDDNTIEQKAHFMQLVDELAFDVALVVLQFYRRETLLQGLKELFERLIAIYRSFTLPK